MKKRFRYKKKMNFLKYIIYVFIIYFSYMVITNYKNYNLANNNADFLKAIINNSNYHMKYERKNQKIITTFLNFLNNFDVNKPLTVFERGFLLSARGENNVDKKNFDFNIEQLNRYAKVVNQSDIKSPKVYIYNSHQHETYSDKGFEDYNISPNVVMASYLLKDKLDKLNIPTVVEEANLIEFMRINNWEHDDSYKASRFYIIDALSKYPNLELIIDLHRDSLTKEQATVAIDNKNFARTLFVVGTNHQKGQENVEFANKINDIFSKKYPTLSRGVYKKHIREIYNQDLSSKMILLEVGGQHSTIDEVLNTVEAVSLIIKDLINNET